MKKLMIIATVAFAACAANATTYAWGLMSGNLDTSKVDAGTAYLCYGTSLKEGYAAALANLTSYDATTITDTLGLTLVKVADKSTYAATADNATFAYKGATDEAGAKKVSANTYITPYSFGDGTSQSGSFYYVIIDDGGKDIAYTTTAKTATINTGTGSGSGTVAAGKFSYAKAADVPEPTSAMLLLLGMAGLALRRRRA